MPFDDSIAISWIHVINITQIYCQMTLQHVSVWILSSWLNEGINVSLFLMGFFPFKWITILWQIHGIVLINLVTFILKIKIFKIYSYVYIHWVLFPPIVKKIDTETTMTEIYGIKKTQPVFIVDETRWECNSRDLHGLTSN